MTKTERIKAAIEGHTCDELPYAIWSHLPGIDLDPVKLAEATYEFFKKYDIDFVKTMNNGMYPIEDFGCEIDFSDIENGGVAKLVKTPIETLCDWKRIEVLDVGQGALGRELRSLELLIEKIDGEAPVVFTVFSPITIANKLCNGTLLEQIERDEEGLIPKALEVIAESTALLAMAAVKIGAAGVFFATQMSSYDLTTEQIYATYGRPYDIKVLEAASEGWFNILHAHGDNIMFDLLKDYPVHVFNWHAWETLPDMEEARAMMGKCLMGGLKRMDITHGNKNEINNQIFHSIKLLERRHHILSPGCVIRYPLDDEMLAFVKQAKLSIEDRLCARTGSRLSK